jgi:hypothetical protein
VWFSGDSAEHVAIIQVDQVRLDLRMRNFEADSAE